jgi:hypothetical protein
MGQRTASSRYKHISTSQTRQKGRSSVKTRGFEIEYSYNSRGAFDLTGNGNTADSVFSSAVKASYGRAVLLVGGLDFYDITFNITAAYPTAWSRWFNKT